MLWSDGPLSMQKNITIYASNLIAHGECLGLQNISEMFTLLLQLQQMLTIRVVKNPLLKWSNHANFSKKSFCVLIN